MSSKKSPAPARPRRRRRAAVALKAAAKKADWDEEIQLVFLGHFTVEQKAAAGIKLDSAQLTESSRRFAGQVGWGLATPIAMLCQGIDDDNLNDDFEDFLAREVPLYLADMESHGRRPPSIVPDAPPPASEGCDLHVTVPAEQLDWAAAALSCVEPLPGADAGAVLRSWSVDFPGGLTARVDIANGEPPYVDAYLVRAAGDAREVVRTLALADTLERTFAFEYDGGVYRVTFHRG